MFFILAFLHNYIYDFITGSLKVNFMQSKALYSGIRLTILLPPNFVRSIVYMKNLCQV